MIAIRDNLRGGGVSRCSQISGLAVTVGFSTLGTIQATWTNPTDTKYKGVRIMCKTGDYPTAPEDGSVFYDSNDATPVSSHIKSGYTDGTTYYLRAFAYTYKNATRLYTTTTDGAQASGTPYQSQGQEIFTSSGNFTAPAGCISIDVFLVGGGGGGNRNGYAGSGGGYTKTYKAVSVTPGSAYPVIVGAGGAGSSLATGLGSTGSESSITIDGTTYSAAGGYGGGEYATDNAGCGGSGGGASDSGTTDVSLMEPDGSHGGDGGSDGSNGYFGSKSAYEYMVSTGDSLASSRLPQLVPSDRTYCQGQGSTTRAFGESGGTLYSGGGGSACNNNSSPLWYGAGGAGGGGKGGAYNVAATAGTPNTGGGGGCGTNYGNSGSDVNGQDGGSGIVIIRWGY